MRPFRATTALIAVTALTGSLSACGEQAISVHDPNATVQRGANLFAQRCSGCHNLDSVGAQGGATKIRDRERVDGPNFNVRKECVQDVLYAIQNGGFSGAIMPENIVVGTDARAVAEFLQKYSGVQAKVGPGSTPITCP